MTDEYFAQPVEAGVYPYLVACWQVKQFGDNVFFLSKAAAVETIRSRIEPPTFEQPQKQERY